MSKLPPPPYSEKSPGRPETLSRERGLRRLSLHGLRAALLSDPEVARASERERLRAAEERAQAAEQALDQLKRETYTGPSAAEAQLRVLQLQYDSLREDVRRPETAYSPASQGSGSTSDLFQIACATDLLFLLDATESMSPYINAAKHQIRGIVNDLRRTFFDEAAVRVAIVAYRDHKDKVKIQQLDFTTDVDEVVHFLDGVKAKGGGDAAEDVLGALDVALDASWQQATRCVIHIADAPPHGGTLHDMGRMHDDYYGQGEEPHGLDHEYVMARMVAEQLNYVFLRINLHTDLMTYMFLKQYLDAAPGARLMTQNKYSHGARAMVAAKRRSRNSSTSSQAMTGLHFAEHELGVQYSALRSLVVGSVTASASHTAVRLSTSNRSSGLAKNGVSMASALEAVCEDDETAIEQMSEKAAGNAAGKPAEKAPEAIRLETTPPQWNDSAWLDIIEHFQAYAVDVVAGPGLLDSMMASDENILISTTELTVRRRSKPFAQGAMRVAMYAQTAESTSRLVVKAPRAGDRRTLVDVAEEMRVQALCKAFALAFNGLVDEKAAVLDFLSVTCLGRGSADTADTADKADCLLLEPLLDGDFVKYNSNCGGLGKNAGEDDRKTTQSAHYIAAQAFSHFTFERSAGRFLVCDLQGVGGVLTDPAVHTCDGGSSTQRFRRTDTNLSEVGFKLFFATHECNRLCTKLGLQSAASIFARDGGGLAAAVFRADWPPETADSHICANKQCGRIVVHAATTRRTGQGTPSAPFTYWCAECWPQLAATTTRVQCLAPGPAHTFKLSTFYYASQGQVRPRLCADHASKAPVTVKTGKSRFFRR